MQHIPSVGHNVMVILKGLGYNSGENKQNVYPPRAYILVLEDLSILSSFSLPAIPTWAFLLKNPPPKKIEKVFLMRILHLITIPYSQTFIASKPTEKSPPVTQPWDKMKVYPTGVISRSFPCLRCGIG